MVQGYDGKGCSGCVVEGWGQDSAIIIMSIKLLVTVAIVLQAALSQQIVDYSHSQYLERR
jgi:hypothetical protein